MFLKYSFVESVVNIRTVLMVQVANDSKISNKLKTFEEYSYPIILY